MPLDVAVYQFTNYMLKPVRNARLARTGSVNLAPGSYLAGTVLAQVTGPANDVQTLTYGSASGGTFTLQVEYPIGNQQTTAGIAYNASAATIQTAIAALANVGSGNVAVTGTGPFTITFQGALASRPVQLMVVNGAALTGGTSPTIAHTTVGTTGGEFAAYAPVTPPAAAATATTNTGTASPPPAGAYVIEYTYANAYGETTVSPALEKNADGTHDIIVASIAFPTGVTAINYYVNGQYDGQLTTAGTFVVNLANVTKQTPPAVNATSTAACLLAIDAQVDNDGMITPSGNSAQTTGGFWGEKYLVAPVYYGGEFSVADLTGLDAGAVSQLKGRFAIGGLTGGVFVF